MASARSCASTGPSVPPGGGTGPRSAAGTGLPSLRVGCSSNSCAISSWGFSGSLIRVLLGTETFEGRIQIGGGARDQNGRRSLGLVQPDHPEASHLEQGQEGDDHAVA